MAFSDLVIGVAKETKLALKLESAPGTQVKANAASMSLITPHAAGSISQALRRIPDPQYRNTRSRLTPITTSFEAGKWSFPALLKTKAGAGAPAAPDIEPLLVGLMGQPATTDATWFGATAHRAYKLVGVSAAGTVYPSFTAWYQRGHTCFYICGATVNQGEFNISGNELCQLNFSGEFMRHGWCGTDVVAAGDSDTGTSLVVGNAKKFFLAYPGDTVFIQVLDPVTYAPKTGWASGIEVTAVNYATNTLTLASGPARADGDIVAPYINLPAEDPLLLPLYGKFGLVRMSLHVDYAAANLPAGTQLVNSARATIVNGIKYYTDIKDDSMFVTQYAATGTREVTGEMNLFFYRNLVALNYKNLSDPLELDYLVIPAQDKTASAGRIFQLHLPRVAWDTPNVTGDEDLTASVGFSSIASEAYNNEAALLYVGG